MLLFLESYMIVIETPTHSPKWAIFFFLRQEPLDEPLYMMGKTPISKIQISYGLKSMRIR